MEPSNGLTSKTLLDNKDPRAGIEKLGVQQVSNWLEKQNSSFILKSLDNNIMCLLISCKNQKVDSHDEILFWLTVKSHHTQLFPEVAVQNNFAKFKE